MTSPAELTVDKTGAALTFTFFGRLDADGIALVWEKACTAIRQSNGPSLTLDLSGVTYLDTAGAAFVVHLNRMALGQNWHNPLVTGLDTASSALVDRLTKQEIVLPDPVPSTGRVRVFVENQGKNLAYFLDDAKTFITFFGELCLAFGSSLLHPGRIRWSETLRVAERSGADALPIVALISFIVGLVMAFQSAIPMKMFGAEIYVANLIGMAMVRELGPLMTAIVLAGRSASAFAAEIGTMKINEEIDALTVMGLEPVRFLILPRVIASTLMTPLLTIFAILVGILGGAVVVMSLGHPFVAYYNQVVGFVSWTDFTGGIIKCFVFGILIAATGCIRGYQTSQGPSAVG
ncbi:MAG: ABC transporter permease, partial [Desulfotignum sp.]|nr:ABC transporter permease [Desulfotignum sp.]